MKFWSRAVMAAVGIAFGLSLVAAYAAAAPSAPRSFKATAQDQKVVLAWSPPSTGAGIDFYQVITAPADFPRTITPFTTITTSSTLKNGTTYSFAVRAHNASGYGPAARITAVPKATPPGPPTNLGATQTGSGQVRLDWTPPTSNGSMPDGSTPSIHHYNVTVSPGGTKATVPASTLTYSVSGLADNLTYTFTVSATNTRPATSAAAVVYAPLPNGASIGLQPTAGVPATSITVTGQLFLKNESITLYWDIPTHVAAAIVSDDNGGFTKVVKPFKGDKPKVHKLCVNVQPKPCANFTLAAAPSPIPSTTPSPGESPSPTPTDTPQASGSRLGGGGLSGLDIITRPPFVFLPIIGIIGLLGVLAYWLLSSRRRPIPPSSPATVVHRATRPDYMAPFPTAGAAPVAPQPPAQPSAWDAPIQAQPPTQQPPPPAVQAPFTPYVPLPVPPQAPPPPVEAPPTPFTPPPAAPQAIPPPAPPREVEWPTSPNPPAVPDEPPDLPQPSD